MDASSKIALQLAPVVRNVRMMQTRTLAGSFVDYDTVATMITGGKIGIYANGVRYWLKRGDVIFMPPMTEHVMIPANEMVNRGIGGDEMQYLARRFAADALQLHPKIVVLRAVLQTMGMKV